MIDRAQCSADQITEKRKEIKYSTREYVIEYLSQKFVDDEFFVPAEYQRNFVWNDMQKCFFIESILMGLPIPFMFFADTDDGRVEIVDGAQRTQTLVQFIQNDLVLRDLQVLTESNGLHFNDLEVSVQRRFRNTNIRVVFLEQTDLASKQEIFRRINTGGEKAEPAEVRRGAFRGKFHEFISECANCELFNSLAPRTVAVEERYEGYELVARFFAYLNNYDSGFPDYDGRVQHYIDAYVDKMNKEFTEEDKTILRNDFVSMLQYVEKSFGQLGFRKSKNGKSTPRARFEALSVGIALALRVNPNASSDKMQWILDPDSETNKDFIKLVKSDAANNKSKLVGRIAYVNTQVLGE